MELIHEKLWGPSGLCAPVSVKEIRHLRLETKPEHYPKYGIPPELSVGLHTALHHLTEREMGLQEVTQAQGFAFVIRVLAEANRPHDRAESFFICLGLAQTYGLTFSCVSDVISSLVSLYEVVAKVLDPAWTPHRQAETLWIDIGQFFCLLGSHLKCTAIASVMPHGMTKEVFHNTLVLMGQDDFRLSIPACKIMRIACAWGKPELHLRTLVELVTKFPERIDDLIVLLEEDLIHPSVAQEWLDCYELFMALNLSAWQGVLGLWTPEDGSLLEMVRTLADDLVPAGRVDVAQVEEDDGSKLDSDSQDAAASAVSFARIDHRQLDVAEFVRQPFSLQCVQLILFHGVVQSVERVDGGWVLRTKMWADCEEAFADAGMKRPDYDQALQFLTMNDVIVAHKKRPAIRLHVEISGATAGAQIVQRVIELSDRLAH